MNDATNPLSIVATTPPSGSKGKKSGWMQAMAEAWSKKLDDKAMEITDVAERIANGDDKPSTLVELTTNAQTMTYLATSTQSTMSTAAEGLNTLARKG